MGIPGTQSNVPYNLRVADYKQHVARMCMQYISAAAAAECGFCANH